MMNSKNFYLPYNPELVPRAKELRKNMTQAERKLWNGFLRSLNIRFFRQRPIDNFIVDFYGATIKLVIEVDGDIHTTTNVQVYDAQRSAILAGYGLTVIRFSNDQVFKEFNWVCDEIEKIINS